MRRRGRPARSPPARPPSTATTSRRRARPSGRPPRGSSTRWHRSGRRWPGTSGGRCTPDGLDAIAALLRPAGEAERDALRAELCIGLHHDVEVTDAPGPRRPRVAQAFCSALPVAYSRIARPAWEPFARLVLEAAYEATLLAACARRLAGGSGTVLLTRLGGGAFGNDDAWIDDAIVRALRLVESQGLDVRLVHRDRVPPAMRALERDSG